MSTPDPEEPTLPARVDPPRSPRTTPAIRGFAIPTSIEEGMRISEIIAASAFAPKDFKGKPGDVFCAVAMGAQVGLAPLQALQWIAVVNGRPSVWGDGALAIVLDSGTVEDFKEWIEGSGDAMVAHCLGKRLGRPSPIAHSFSVADAKMAKLWGKKTSSGYDTPWITNPKRMLQMRARGFTLRDGWADKLAGLSIREETEDYEPLSPEEKPERPAIELPRRVGEAAPVVVLPPDPPAPENGGPAGARASGEPGDGMQPPLPLASAGGRLPPAEPTITEKQRQELYQLCNRHGKRHSELKTWLTAQGCQSTVAIPAALLEPAKAWVKGERAPGAEG